MSIPAPVFEECALCGRKADVREYLCAGCDHTVCQQCDVTHPTGEHRVEAHRAPAA